MAHDHPRGKEEGQKSSRRERPLPARLKQEKVESTNPLPTPRPHRAPPVTLSFVFTAGRLLAALLQVPRETCSRSLKVKPSRLLRLCDPGPGRPYYTARSRPSNVGEMRDQATFASTKISEIWVCRDVGGAVFLCISKVSMCLFTFYGDYSAVPPPL